jgi:hypothetical protein
VNIGVAWPIDSTEAWARVLRMQTKLHRWAVADAGRRFDDVFNLVYDPAFLAAAGPGADQHRRPHRRGGSDRTAVDHFVPGHGYAR